MKVLYILDGSAFLYRSFFALPPLSTSKGFPTGAIYGFMRAVFSILKTESPKYFVVVFDHPSPTTREKIYKEYKSKRPTMPDSLKVQIPVIKNLLRLMGISVIELEGYEADDLIGYITERALELGFHVRVYSPDKDVLQLVSERVIVINPISKDVFDHKAVLEKFGVVPGLIPDYLALVGDKVDNVEGVKGIGKKTALRVLKEYGNVENILRNWEDFSLHFPHADKEKLKLAYSLVKLHPVYGLKIELENLTMKRPDKDTLTNIFLELEVKSLIKDLEAISRSTSQKELF
ncbi:MAG: 5'-3' exonuclease H3TH domain-containing protein [Aquificaceae bacterium]